MSKFIQPVSMRVTEEQYLRDLREPLLAMGYGEHFTISSPCSFLIITNNFANKEGSIGSLKSRDRAEAYDRHFIPNYNPEYFLAVAAMTNEEYGIVGEWWKCINDVVMESNKIAYYSNKLYKSELENCITDTDGNKYHIWTVYSHMFKYFTKATLSDLINHFEPKINNKNTMTELTQQEKETLAKLITKDNEAIFEKIGVKRDKNPIGVLRDNSHAKEEIAKYIVAAELTPSVIGKKELISRAFTMSSAFKDQYKFVLHEKDGLQVLAIEEK